MDCHASFHSARPLCAPHGDDDLNKLCNDRKKSVITSGSEVIHIQKFVNFLNNKVVFPKGRLWRTPCVLFSKLLTQWAEATLLSKFFTFDNLSRSNPCFVINNFIHKEDILWEYQQKNF